MDWVFKSRTICIFSCLYLSVCACSCNNNNRIDTAVSPTRRWDQCALQHNTGRMYWCRMTEKGIIIRQTHITHTQWTLPATPGNTIYIPSLYLSVALWLYLGTCTCLSMYICVFLFGLYLPLPQRHHLHYFFVEDSTHHTKVELPAPAHKSFRVVIKPSHPRPDNILPTGSRTGCVVGWSVSLLTLCHVVCRQAIMRHHQHPITTIIMFTSSLLSAYPSPTHLSTPHLHHVTFRPQCWLHSTRVPGSRDCTLCARVVVTTSHAKSLHHERSLVNDYKP